MSDAKLLTVSASPHVKSRDSVSGIMGDVCIALIPAAVVAIFSFGWHAALLIAVCIGSCLLFEWLSRKIMKRTNTIGDLSCVVTGLLLAFNLPADLPVWMAVIGSFVAIVVVKQFFGGIGQNFANPAITARIVLLVSFASEMTKFAVPSGVDAVTSATPLGVLSGVDRAGNISTQLNALVSEKRLAPLLDMFLGQRAGSIGEVCTIALLIGAVYLLVRRVISIAIPGSYILTVGVFMLFASHFNIEFTAYELLGGGLILGAFFMATDYSTSPINIKGKIVFGIGCGILTSVIRLYGSLPEGVSYSILLMNIACPLIEKATAPDYFGMIKEKKNKKKAGENA